MNLFEPEKPLAERMRPQSLEDYIGQEHLIGVKGVLRKVIDSGNLPSMILWGPPGVGKTSLALLFSQVVKGVFYHLSAINTGVKELREVIEKARFQRNSIVFIDEIHRFNKGQQDSLLAAVEKGHIKLIGATTENPSFEVNAALLSRMQVYVLQNLEQSHLEKLIQSALKKDVVLSKLAIEVKEIEELIRISGGDARRLLNLLELVVQQQIGQDTIAITNELVKETVKLSPLRYDKAGDMHYDVISAFIKSIRGSDPNASVYWLARMIEAGEDPKFIARRLLILASEDIGLANPNALLMANQCFQAVQVIGYPECRIILSQTVIYLATSLKSNSAYLAISEAQDLVRKTGNLLVPQALQGSYTKLDKQLGKGRGYLYSHDFEGHFVEQDFMPEEIRGEILYEPGDNSKEISIKEWLRRLWKSKYKY